VRGRNARTVSLEDKLREQIEMWQLAQALCASHQPALQASLDDVRREIMSHVSRNEIVIEDRPGEFTSLAKHKMHCLWTDFQITPEVTIDSRLRGHLIPGVLVTRLLDLHRQQIRLVASLIRG